MLKIEVGSGVVSGKFLRWSRLRTPRGKFYGVRRKYGVDDTK